jgi:hypothetical protein
MPDQGELFETAEICKVPDEITGLAIRSFLLENGIEAELRNLEASFFGNVLSNLQGFWGAVQVPKVKETEAKKLYAVFMKEFEGK